MIYWNTQRGFNYNFSHNSSLKIIITIFALVLVLTSFQPSFGRTVTYETLTPLKGGNPNVCIFEPDYVKDTMIFGAITKTMVSETKGAIDQWESLLKGSERKREDMSKWEINYSVVSLHQQSSFDKAKCSVLIQFFPVPNTSESWLRSLGATENKDGPDNDFRLISVFYKKMGYCEDHRDEHNIYYKPCYINDVILSMQIGNTVRHEFGHALGLGHYYFDDIPDYYWNEFGVPYPSVMVRVGADIYEQQQIKQIDIDKVREIYGKGGFEKPDLAKNPTTAKSPEDTSSIPDWVRSDARWYSEGLINDSEFTKGIEYLIKHNIMKIPNLPKQPSEMSEGKVPEWVRSNTKWWSEGTISDGEFIKGIQYLVEKGVILV